MIDKSNYVPVVISAKRTPIGKFQGSLASLGAVDLGAQAVRQALKGIPSELLPQIDEVIIGNVVSAGLGQAPARQVAIAAGIPSQVGSLTINKVCGSGLKSISLATTSILAGEGQLFVAGGMESMSGAPYLMHGRNGELRFGHTKLVDSLLADGLWDPFENWGMGNAAELIAKKYAISRSEMDEYALASHQKALAARAAGSFLMEIVPVPLADKKGNSTTVSQDESPRDGITIEALEKLKPAFEAQGVVTAGNSSPMSDGAAACVISSERWAKEMGIKPMARIVAFAQAAVEPRFLFDAPSLAIPKVLQKSGWKMADLDLIELNEAFAAQTLANGKALADSGWDWSKVNIYGGAIALGHPLGASGTRVLVTLLHALNKTGGSKGLACLCLGGGEAVALTVERL